MRALLASLLAVVFAAALAASCGAATVASAGCAPAGAQVKISDRRAQVYALQKAIYACDRRTRRTTKLGEATTCIATSQVERLALAADVVAYGLERCGVDTGSTSILVRRLSDGKQLRNLSAITGPGLVESFQSIDSLVVTPKGAVAWIATDSSVVAHGKRIEVHANRRLLDSGPSIVSSSLRLHGSKLTWRNGARMRTATI